MGTAGDYVNYTEEYLRYKWVGTLRKARLLDKAAGEAVLTDLLARYSEPHRFYHTLSHLEACFRILDEYFPDFAAIHHVELALWFHDAVYDTTAKDNEERSADLAKVSLASLGATSILQHSVSELVLTTKHTDLPSGAGAKVLLDVDTHVLGACDSVYQEYEDNIRREYSWVPLDIYRQKRTEILQMFLKRPFIFTTEIFHGTYDAQARKNLARAIKALA
jgi:predicted metal-dependent HD superfamily phosphohydrolase